MVVVGSEGVDCVVVNYRTPQDLFSFGDSYLRQNYPSTLTIVNVDPTPEDVRTAEWLCEKAEATYVEFHENVGYARAVNYGLRLATFPVVAAFNADVEIPEGGLEACCSRLLSQPDWGILGPIQVDQRGRLTHAGVFGSNEEPSFEGAWLQIPSDRHRVVRSAVSVSGSAYFVRREAWEELTDCPVYQASFPGALGAFLPTPFYYEEMGCSLHARDHGWEVVYDGTVTPFIHQWHRSVHLNRMEVQATRWMEESLDMFREFCDNHGIDHE